MSVNNTLKLKWDGENYQLKMTMEVIDRIEEEINLVKLAHQLQSGDTRFSVIAKFLAIVLQAAGCEVDQEEIFTEIFGDESDETQQAVFSMTMSILSSCFIRSKKKPSGKRKK